MSVPNLSPEQIAELDAVVARAHDAAEAFRKLDQEAVDRIVWAMVTAGLDAAVELALAGRSRRPASASSRTRSSRTTWPPSSSTTTSGTRRPSASSETDAQRGIEYVAEPIGVVLAITPITNPTSTVLFKAIVAAKTRNAIIFRPSPFATRCAERVVEVLREAGEAAGMPPGALQVVPDPAHELTHHLFHHPDVDFIWTTGGPKIVELTNKAGKPSPERRPRQRTRVRARSRPTSRWRVVDVLISKTFDDSVICPAEQTAIIDDEIYDATVAEFERMGARLMTEEEADRLAEFAFGGDGHKVNLMALGQPAPVLAGAGRARGRRARQGADRRAAERPGRAGAPIRSCQEKLMPVLGLVRRPRRRARDRLRPCWSPSTVAWATPRPSTPATRPSWTRYSNGGAHRPHPGQRADRGRRPRRRLQQLDADVLAGLRHVGRLDDDGQRQLQEPAEHQDRVPAPDAAAVVPGAGRHLLQPRRAGEPAGDRRPPGRHRHR